MKRDIACKHNQPPQVVVAKRGDLQMGCLSFREPERGEECSLHPTVAFKWPSASTAQLVVSISHIADIRRAEPGVPSCTFGGQPSTNGNLYREITVTTGRVVLSIGEISPLH